ncbi:uncharacterized protein BBA_02906 [Beauveria bassiana ARSEF 2860]|uniref:Uncharacterized protein n=1 Tax=Beauveria bassiana (strain ARSEF 2860) TaxID=655819 RepID=J4WD89_BEAB2|nr:uncharacterized protein BBA_02906 [Beauveria bassiana ARSEF 2860]EJP68010.1 hypothetical protein BBA_02906 [Beauveria bassiana ARSEF 2860]
MNESLRPSMWRPLGAVGAATDAATDAASSPHANSPTQNTGSSPPFGIDPPRPPREGYDVSSSIREVLRGDTPPASPLMPFTTTCDNTWITNTFPGGEAVRVSTPPMDEDTADGKPRGFFGPLTPPESDTTGSQTYHTPMTSTYASPKYNAHRMSVAIPSREWWEGKLQKPTRHKDMNCATKFEFDVPEHLPNSPMCPANVRHKSGGSGLCVYHGRRRALSTAGNGGPKRHDSNSTS